MKKTVSNIYRKVKPYLPFVCLFIFYFLLQYKLVYISDDVINSTRTYKDGQISYIIETYFNYSSRLLIYLVNNYFYMFPMMVWKIVDSIIIVIGAVCVSKLFNEKKDLYIDYIICLLVTLFPFIIMNSAGFIATTITYYWPIVALLMCMVPLKKVINKEKVKNYLYPIYFVLLLYATDCEQIACLLFGLSVCFIVYLKFIKKEKKIHWYVYSLLILSLLKMIFIKTCPGNIIRSNAGLKGMFDLYDQLSLFDKLYMGLLYTTKVLISNGIPLFILSLFLCIRTNLKSKNRINIILSNLMVVLVFTLCFMQQIAAYYAPSVYKLISVFDYQILSPDYRISKFSILISGALYGGIVYLLIVNFKNKLLPLILFLGGIATQMIMIFSASIYFSSHRTGSIMFYSIVLINIILFKDIDPHLKENKRNLIISFLILISFVYAVKFCSLF